MPNESMLHGGRWQAGFWINVLGRQAEQLEWLCDTPLSIMLKSSTKGPRFGDDLTEVMRTFWLKQADLGAKIDIARSTLSESKWDWFPQCGGHYLQLIISLYENAADFNKLLHEAVIAHKKYWNKNKEDRKVDWNGFVAIELCALAAIAHDRGMKVEVESDYLPMPLVTGEILKLA
jgi:hypothetical protein